MPFFWEIPFHLSITKIAQNTEINLCTQPKLIQI